MKSRKKPALSGSVSSSSAVMVVDGTAVRTKARRDYEKLSRELEVARTELRTFQETDKPQFARWLSQRFGKTLTALHEANRALEEKQRVLRELESEAQHSSVSEAYARVMHPDENKVEEPEAEDEKSSKREHNGGFADDMADFFSRMEEEWGQAFGEAKSKRAPTLSQAARKARLKEVYRLLVRRLHPDTQKNVTTRKKEWWLQAQEAYQASDLEQLELILHFCEVEDEGPAKATVSVLMKLIKEFRRALKGLKNEVFECRQDPAWKFGEKADHSDIEKEARTVLEGKLRLVQTVLKRVEEKLQVWAEAADRDARRKQRVPSRGRRAPQSFFEEI